MERPRTTGGPVYRRQQSNTSSSSGAPESPTISPLHHHHQQQQRYARSPSTGAPAGNVRRAQNTAARAAAQRLARVMAHQPGEDESGSDDESMAPPVEILSTPRRAARSPSPAVVTLPSRLLFVQLLLVGHLLLQSQLLSYHQSNQCKDQLLLQLHQCLLLKVLKQSLHSLIEETKEDLQQNGVFGRLDEVMTIRSTEWRARISSRPLDIILTSNHKDQDPFTAF